MPTTCAPPPTPDDAISRRSRSGSAPSISTGRRPEKVGLRTLGTDFELISEERARDLRPSSMVVLPWYFKNEIVAREQDYLRDGGKLLFPMPYAHVVTKDGEVAL